MWHLHLPQQIVLLAVGIALVGGHLFRAPRLWGSVAIAALLAAAGALALGVAGSGILPADHIAAALVGLALVVGLPMVLAAFEPGRKSGASAEYFGLSLVGVLGLMLAATAGDLILLALAVELAALPGYLLAYLSARNGRDGGNPANVSAPDRHTAPARGTEEVLLKLLLPGAFASALLWFGFALVATEAGTTDLAGVAEAFSGGAGEGEETAEGAPGAGRLSVLAIGAIFVAAAIRMAAIPFHFGLAEVIDRAGFAEGGWLNAGPRLAGWIVLVKVALFAMPGCESACLALSGMLAAGSLVVGGVLSLAQARLRPLLAYAAIGQGGLALAGLAAAFAQARLVPVGLSTTPGIPGGLHASLFHLATFLLMSGGLAAILAYFDRAGRPIEYIEDLAGWARDEPLGGTCAALLLLGLAGLPLLPGFWSRLFLAGSILSVEPDWLGDWAGGFHPGMLVLTGAMLLGCVLIAAAYLRVASALIFERPLSRPRPEGGRPALAAGVLAALLAVGIGLFPGPILGWLKRPAASVPADGEANRRAAPDYGRTLSPVERSNRS